MVYFVVAKNNDQVFGSYVGSSLMSMNAQCAVVVDDEGKKESLFQKYNQAVDQYIKDGIKEEDVLVFCHEDVKIVDPNFVEKMEFVFKEKEDVGLVGVVGCMSLSETGAWWHNPPHQLRGHIVQENGDKATHLIKGPIGYFDDGVAVDGVCFGIKADLFINFGLRFDQSLYNGFDFYDIDTCFSVLEKGKKIAIVDALIQHKSIGDIREKKGWHESRDVFVKKWKGKGVKFPVTNQHFLAYENVQIVEV